MFAHTIAATRSNTAVENRRVQVPGLDRNVAAHLLKPVDSHTYTHTYTHKYCAEKVRNAKKKYKEQSKPCEFGGNRQPETSAIFRINNISGAPRYRRLREHSYAFRV